MNTFNEVMEKLKSAKNIALFAHENPDGDAFGSLVAAKAILEEMGKRAVICLNEEPPRKFSYILDGNFKVMPKNEDFDTALALDCGAFKRLGELCALYETIETKLSIDHHFSNTPFADCYYTDHQAAANCELIYDMAIALCKKVPKHALAALYTGLSTDTGHFKFSNVTKKTLTIAAELVGLGLDHRKITEGLYDTVKKEKLSFLGDVYQKIEYFAEGKISFLYCSNELMNQYGIDFSDIEELPNTVLSIEGVKVSILLKDKENGGYKISMRGKDVCDLASIAAIYGGGGHVNAAGLSVDGDVKKVISDLTERIDKKLKESDL